MSFIWQSDSDGPTTPKQFRRGLLILAIIFALLQLFVAVGVK